MVGMFFSSFYIFTVSYIQIRCAKLATFFEFTKVHIVFSQKILKRACCFPVSVHRLAVRMKPMWGSAGNEKSGDFILAFGLWALTDSNRRPSACKADALNQLS